MNIKHSLIYACFGVLISSQAFARAWPSLRPSFIVAPGYTRLTSSQNIWLARTPDPGLENNYINASTQHGSFLLGFALEQPLHTSMPNIDFAVGLEGDYIRNPSISGEVHPMVNVDPDFDTLNYSYEMNAYLLQATGKLSIQTIFPRVGAYLQAGIGGALNQLFHYTETSPFLSSAAPMLSPFGNQSTCSFAYALGASLLFQIGETAQAGIGYRFIQTGRASLKSSPVQETSDHLVFTPLNHHFLIFSLTI